MTPRDPHQDHVQNRRVAGMQLQGVPQIQNSAHSTQSSQSLPLSLLIKPSMILGLRYFPTKKKPQFHKTVTELWTGINVNPPGSPDFQRAYAQLVQVTAYIRTVVHANGAKAQQQAQREAQEQSQQQARSVTYPPSFNAEADDPILGYIAKPVRSNSPWSEKLQLLDNPRRYERRLSDDIPDWVQQSRYFERPPPQPIVDTAPILPIQDVKRKASGSPEEPRLPKSNRPR